MEDPSSAREEQPPPSPPAVDDSEPPNGLGPGRENHKRIATSINSDDPELSSTKRSKLAMDQQTQSSQWPSPSQDGQHEGQPGQPSAGSAPPEPWLDGVIDRLERVRAEQDQQRVKLDVIIQRLKQKKAEQDLNRDRVLEISAGLCELHESKREDLRLMEQNVDAITAPQGLAASREEPPRAGLNFRGV